MSVTQLVCRSAMIAAILGASARGDAMLTLGSFTSASASGTSASSQGGSGFNLGWTDPTNQVRATPSFYPSASSFSPPTTSQASTPPAPTYDAFLNFGSGGFLNAGSLTTPNPQAWYDSSKITGLFGGMPNPSQIAAFDATVLQRVQQTFALGGVPVTLTDNPNASAAHMLSLVSNAVNPSMTGAIGMTNIGGSGFHFIDNSAPYAQSVDQLEWIVAHNVAHELMLAFGVPEVHDQTGQYIDSTTGSISMFLNKNATFSTGAVQDLLSRNFLQPGGAIFSTGPQLVGAAVPEPTTLAAWGLVVGTLIAAQRLRSRRASA